MDAWYYFRVEEYALKSLSSFLPEDIVTERIAKFI